MEINVTCSIPTNQRTFQDRVIGFNQSTNVSAPRDLLITMRRIFCREQCDQIWRKSPLRQNFDALYLVFGKFFYILWHNLYAIWRIFIVVNAQILNSYLAIWSLSGQSYKASTIVIYYSRVVPDLKIPHITTLEL